MVEQFVLYLKSGIGDQSINLMWVGMNFIQTSLSSIWCCKPAINWNWKNKKWKCLL